MFRGVCRKYYYFMEEDQWWEYFAERYCELYPEQQIRKRWVTSPAVALNELKKSYGHIYNVEWNKKSLARYNNGQYYINENGDRVRRWRRRGAVKAELTAAPPDSLSEIIALCVLKEIMLKNEAEIDRLVKMNNKYYWARVGNKNMWNLWWDHGGNESLHELWAINPLTGKPIRKDSNLYQSLMKNGYFD